MSNDESSSEILVQKDNNELEYDLEDNNSKSPVMILSIDVGNGKVEQLKLYSLESPKKDLYKFCTANKLDYDTMDEIINQVEELIKDRLNESNQNENEDKDKDEESKEEKEESKDKEKSNDNDEESIEEKEISKYEEEKKEEEEKDINLINKNKQKNNQIHNKNDKYRNNKSYNHKPINNLTKYNLKKQVNRTQKINNNSSVSLFQYQINDK